MNREAIIEALFARLTGAASFASAGRRLKLWSDVPASEKPALFLTETGEHYSRASEAVPETVTLMAEVTIYIDAGKDPSLVPASSLNDLLDALDAALAPEAHTGRQTLGGLVSHCWIEGRVIKDAGDIGGDGMAVVPIRMLVPR